MASPMDVDENSISSQLLQRLSHSPYDCSSLVLLPGRPDNYVFRGILAQPLVTDDGGLRTSVIIKHSTDCKETYLPIETTCEAFEELLLCTIADYSPPQSTTTVMKAPKLYLYDRETNTQVLEDFTDSNVLMSILSSPNADHLLPSNSPAAIGHHLGAWLRFFHNWASSPEQAALQGQMWQKTPVRTRKFRITYGSFLITLEKYPELLNDHQRKTLEAIRDVLAEEFEKVPADGDDKECWGLVHGDFWSGNFLLRKASWDEPPTSPDGINNLFIIDWEYAQFGHRSIDLGQGVGDLYERKLFNKIELARPVMEGLIKGYGNISDELAFRTALYVGVHLVRSHNRRSRKSMDSRETAIAHLTIARDFILKAWERDRQFFADSVLSPLFVRK